MIYEGGCHCGELRYRLDWPAAAGHMPARRCTCAYCTRFNAAWTSHPEAGLDLVASEPDVVRRYRFGTETADFLFCARCGVTVAAIGEAPQGPIAIVNVNTLDRCDELEFDHSDSDFEEETREQRLARRAERWIGRVALSGPDWAGR